MASIPVAGIEVRKDNGNDIDLFLISKNACDSGIEYGENGELECVVLGEEGFIAEVGDIIVAHSDGKYIPMPKKDYEQMIAEMMKKYPD